MTKIANLTFQGNDTLFNNFFNMINDVAYTDPEWLASSTYSTLQSYRLTGTHSLLVEYTYHADTNSYTIDRVTREYGRGSPPNIYTNQQNNDAFDLIKEYWKAYLFKQGQTIEKRQALYHHLVIMYFSKLQDLFQYVQHHLNKNVGYRWQAGSFKRDPAEVEAFYKMPYTYPKNIFIEHASMNSLIELIDRLQPHQEISAEASINALHIESGLNTNLWSAFAKHLETHGNNLTSFIPIIRTFILDAVNVEARYHAALTAVTSFTATVPEAKTSEYQEFHWTDDNGQDHLVHTSVAELLWLLSELSKNIQAGIDVDLNNRMLKPLIHHVLHTILLQTDEFLLRGLILHFAPTLTTAQVDKLIHQYVVARK